MYLFFENFKAIFSYVIKDETWSDDYGDSYTYIVQYIYMCVYECVYGDI